MQSPPPEPAPMSIDELLDGARDRYENSTDFTLGIEEEYALCDPTTLDLVPEYDRANALAPEYGLATAVAGELLASEIEFRTGRCECWSDAVTELTQVRASVARMMLSLDLAVGTSGTHPWADYREQEKIDLPYYRRLVEKLQYVAHRNNTFGLHVHVGVRGVDRAVAVADALRTVQPLLLALSASSPFIDGRDSGLCSTRSMTFSRTFPRGNIAPAFGTWQAFTDYVRFLRDVGSIDTFGQMWWGVRVHALHGTVELRMFDGQPDVRDTLALAALAVGTVADLCGRYDAGELAGPLPEHLIDENSWRATRFGTAGEMIDLPGTKVLETTELIARLIANARVAGTAAGLGLDAGLDRCEAMLARGCSALVQRAASEAAGGELLPAYRQVVETTMTSAVEAPTRA